MGPRVRVEWGAVGLGRGIGIQFNYSKTRPWLYKDRPSGAAWGRFGPSAAEQGRVGPVRAEWGWGGVGHALGFN